MMRCPITIALLAAVAFVATPSAVAQGEGNTPPAIIAIDWQISRIDFRLGGYLFPVPFDPDTERAFELDQLIATITVEDPDFAGDGDDEVFALRQSVGFFRIGYPSPEAPPIPEDDAEFQPVEGDGYAPAGAGTTVDIVFRFTLPEINGKHQARLRGIIDWDALYLIRFLVSNSQDPGCQVTELGLVVGPCDEPVAEAQQFVAVLEHPQLAPPNPPPFADAGPDQIVEAGETILLDGSSTFDGFNVGFDIGSADIFEKDNITFTWEWISGPERVDPIHRDPVNQPAVAEVTLNQIGTYIYRLAADDNVNSLPSMDAVEISVVSLIPENRAPTAVINGPTGPVVVGSVVMLDGTSSSDPDGDPLNFRWRQIDELGGNLDPETIADVFQPLGGLESPISTWQAVKSGTFHFRLLVSDGRELGDTRFSLTVIEPGAPAVLTADDGTTKERDEPSNTPADGGSDVSAAPACGGSLLPLAALPLMLAPMRRRCGADPRKQQDSNRAGPRRPALCLRR